MFYALMVRYAVLVGAIALFLVARLAVKAVRRMRRNYVANAAARRREPRLIERDIRA